MTIRKVKIVVEVLMTSCQISLKPNSGAVVPHSATAPTAIAKASGWPMKPAIRFAAIVNKRSISGRPY